MKDNQAIGANIAMNIVHPKETAKYNKQHTKLLMEISLSLSTVLMWDM
jgi:hypothetical protein